ncbi:MAG: NifB/NifX family molybdenum-iron cluster-binding protein [Candidatus Hydrogenedentota bacterium]
MKIVVTALGARLDSRIDPRFGRCQYLIIYDTETKTFESIANENVMAGGGAGIKTAQYVVDKGVVAVITGNVGPNAYRVLSQAGIKIAVNADGTVNDMINKFIEGSLKFASDATVSDHFGISNK